MVHEWKFFCISLLILCLSACGDIIEENISNEELLLLAPGDSAIIASDTVSFWWEKLPGARDYEFRLVSPSFSNLQQVIADSITQRNLLKFVLGSGEYEWEVRALNNGYATDFFYRSFTVDSTGSDQAIDISAQQVSILAPGDSAVITIDSVSFWWEKLSGAVEYQFRLVSPSFSNPQRVIADSITQKNLLAFVLVPGAYEWKVRALNDDFATEYASRSFWVDSSGTSQDISSESLEILTPADGAELFGSEVSFWWEEMDGADAYELRIASPSLSSVAWGIDTLMATNKFSMALEPNTYEWRIRAVNSGFQTQWQKFGFSLDSEKVADISGEEVILRSPADSLETAQNEITLWWYNVEGADTYSVEVVSPSFEDTQLHTLDETLTEDKLKVTLDSGVYQWSVKAMNSRHETEPSVRTLFITNKL